MQVDPLASSYDTMLYMSPLHVAIVIDDKFPASSGVSRSVQTPSFRIPGLPSHTNILHNNRLIVNTNIADSPDAYPLLALFGSVGIRLNAIRISILRRRFLICKNLKKILHYCSCRENNHQSNYYS